MPIQSVAAIKSALDTAIATTVSKAPQYSEDIRHFQRKRKLPLETVIRLLLGMTGGALTKELHAAGVDASPSAFVQQRHKISSAAFRDILQDFNSKCHDDKLYRGQFRLLALDGSTISLPYDPSAESFLKVDTHPKGGYNAWHLTPLYDLVNKTYYDCVIQPKSKADEQAALIQMIYKNRFPEKTILIADRGLESYNIFAHLLTRAQANPGLFFLIRIRNGRSCLKPVSQLPLTQEFSKWISFTLSTKQTKAAREAGHLLMQMTNNSGHKHRARWDFSHIDPFHMRLRIVNLQLDTGEYELLACNLPDYMGIDEIRNLYKARWGLETAFRELKYGLNLISPHSRLDDFTKSEVYCALTMANFCSRIASKVVIQQKRENVYAYKVNMKMAIYLAKEYFRDPNGDAEKLVHDIGRYTEPIRPGRQDQRNLKTKSCTSFCYRVAA